MVSPCCAHRCAVTCGYMQVNSRRRSCGILHVQLPTSQTSPAHLIRIPTSDKHTNSYHHCYMHTITSNTLHTMPLIVTLYCHFNYTCTACSNTHSDHHTCKVNAHHTIICQQPNLQSQPICIYIHSYHASMCRDIDPSMLLFPSLLPTATTHLTTTCFCSPILFSRLHALLHFTLLMAGRLP